MKKNKNIEALEKLVQIKEETIKELEKQIQILKNQPPQIITVPQQIPFAPINPIQPYNPPINPWQSPYIFTCESNSLTGAIGTQSLDTLNYTDCNNTTDINHPLNKNITYTN